MNMVGLMRLKQRIHCGEFACLTACCDKLPDIFHIIRSLSEEELDLFYGWICGMDCGTGPGAGPGGDGSGIQQTCTAELRTLICTEAVQQRAKVGKAVLDGVIAAWPSDTFLPVLKRAYQAGAALLGMFLSFCASPEGGNIDQVVSKMCEYYRIIRGVQDQLKNLPAPLDKGVSALDNSLFPAVRNALDRCCAENAGAGSGTSLEPGTIAMVRPLPRPSATANTRPTLNRAAIASLRGIKAGSFNGNPFGL